MKSWNKIKMWRKARRAELIAARAALAPGRRKAWNDRMTVLLEAAFVPPSGTVIGYCWPYKGEFDARFAVRRWRGGGAIAALPEVVEKARPMRFRKWWPGAPMKRGVYDIPVPDSTEVLLPDVAVVPMNGFDERGYRLGYGGGYFDRTLAALEWRVLTIGVGFEASRLPTIYPQPHDIPMDFVVTEAGIYLAGGSKLALIDTAKAAADAASILQRRRLPRLRHPSPAVIEDQPTRAYSSPPCYAHEIGLDAKGDAAPMPRDEVAALLNSLLEAERAGAKALAAFMNDHERDTPAWRQLAAVQRDEAGNCATLIDLIRLTAGAPSTLTGSFLEKALAVKGKAPRLEFLNLGQKWVVRKIGEALPRLENECVRAALFAMQLSHLANIEKCQALVDSLKARSRGNRKSRFRVGAGESETQ